MNLGSLWGRLDCGVSEVTRGRGNEDREWTLVFGGFDLESEGNETEGRVRVKERYQEGRVLRKS